MSFDVFENNQANKKETLEKYLEIQNTIFDTFNTPSGKRMLELLELKTMFRKDNLPLPRTSDQQVNFLTECAYRQGRKSVVEEIKQQIKLTKERKANE